MMLLSLRESPFSCGCTGCVFWDQAHKVLESYVISFQGVMKTHGCQHEWLHPTCEAHCTHDSIDQQFHNGSEGQCAAKQHQDCKADVVSSHAGLLAP